MNILGTRIILIYMAFQDPIMTYHKIVEPRRAGGVILQIVSAYFANNDPAT